MKMAGNEPASDRIDLRTSSFSAHCKAYYKLVVFVARKSYNIYKEL